MLKGIQVFQVLQTLHHPLAKRQSGEFCERLAWSGLNFRGKKSWSKMTWNWDLSLLEKFVVNMQCAAMKCEITRKPIVLERVEANSLKSTHYY